MHRFGHQRRGNEADSRKTVKWDRKKEWHTEKPSVTSSPGWTIRQKLIHTNKHTDRLCVLQYNRDIILRDAEKSSVEDERTHKQRKNSKFISIPANQCWGVKQATLQSLQLRDRHSDVFKIMLISSYKRLFLTTVVAMLFFVHAQL